MTDEEFLQEVEKERLRRQKIKRKNAAGAGIIIIDLFSSILISVGAWRTDPVLGFLCSMAAIALVIAYLSQFLD